jgi:hypothetical protein
VPVPEPLSETLRRLHREATLTTPGDITTTQRLQNYIAARATIDNALPALADLVELLETEDSNAPNHPRHACPRCRALAVLSERLGAKP